MEPKDGTSKAQAHLQESYEAVGASILALEVRAQCQKHVAKLRGLLRGIYNRSDPPPFIAD